MAATLLRSGKVRDIYDLGDRLLLVASDRVSAFDWVIPTPIPDKGRVLTQVSRFWFDLLDVENHILSYDADANEIPEGYTAEDLAGRSMVVKKCDVVPVECVVRGYLVGSGWKDYQQTGSVCGIPLPEGMQNCEKIEDPIFTPATKAEEGHDENISIDEMASAVGEETALELKQRSIEIYNQGRDHAAKCGIIIADTKFEWGWYEGRLILIDEVMTPDSSRFWPVESYQPGANPPSFDKQFVRDYLTSTSWDKNSPPPELPAEIVKNTRAKYIEAYEKLTGNPFPWK